MKRIAFLSLLLIPSAAAAQDGDKVHSTPYPDGRSVIGNSIEQGVAQYGQQSALGHCDDICGSAWGAGHAGSLNACGEATGGWFGDIGFYVLRPQWSGGNPAFAAQTTDVGTGATARQQFDFDHDYNFAPLVSIGYAGPNGLGFRGRWWTLRSREGFDTGVTGTPDDNYAFATPSLLGTGGNVNIGDGEEVAGSFRNRLAMDVIDLERTWSNHFGRSALLLSSGVRYAHVGQTYDADLAFSDGIDPTINNAFRFNNTFNGVGPTAALQAFRQIGTTNLSVYGLSRGSLLFGERRQRAFSVVDGVDDQVSLTHNSVLPVMEIEAGTNWTRNMGAYDFFAEGGFVGMVWFNAGNAANSDAIVADVFNTAGTDNVNQNLGLVGLRFSTGIRF